MEPLDPQSIIEAAEHAAASGDYASAEKFLREAARAQERRLGPLSPELANTLNNLGVVCEINGKPADAEECFRRALAIATDVLEPNHPFIETSRQNLRGFCDAKVKTDAESAPPREESRELQLVVQRRPVRAFPAGVIGPAVMLIIIGIAAAYPFLGSIGRAQSSSVATIEVPQAAPAPTPAPATTEKASPVEPTPAPQIAAIGGIEADPRAGDVTVDPAARPTVVKARLCVELDDWLCNPADLPVTSGPLFFFTQVKSPTAATIQHRWYRGNSLQHSVDLRIEASPGGYRSYSRMTMTGDSTGDWRVELRAEDGKLLHEERFPVQ